MPKNGKCLCAVLTVIGAIVTMTPVNAGAQSNQAQVKKQVRTLENKAHKSQSVINFFNNKGRWALYLHREKCWYVSVPKGRKTCTRARRLVSYHAKRLRNTSLRLAQLKEQLLPIGKLSDWICIHGGEGSWTANTGNGYYGGLQMDMTFQRTYGPEFLAKYGTADKWPPRVQIAVAYRAYRGYAGEYARYYGPWPNTARDCGLR